MKDISLVILPQWLTHQLEDNNLSLPYALDLYALSRIQSLKDVSFYVALNSILFDKMPEAIKKTFRPVNLYDGLQHMLPDRNGYYPDSKVVQSLCESIQQRVYTEYEAKNFLPDTHHLLDILPHNELEGLELPLNVEERLNFTLINITDDVYGISFTVKDKKIPSIQQSIQSYDAALALLIGMYSFEDVARSALFKSYTMIARSLQE